MNGYLRLSTTLIPVLLVGALILYSCGGGGSGSSSSKSPPPEPQKLLMELLEPELDMKAGRTGEVVIRLKTEWSTATVALSVRHCPEAVTCTLNDTLVRIYKDQNELITLSIVTTATTLAGSYTIVVVGETQGALEHYQRSLSLTLNVSESRSTASFQTRQYTTDSWTRDSMAIADLNRDGYPDVVYTARGHKQIGMMLGSQTGDLVSTTATIESFPTGIAVGQIDETAELSILVSTEAPDSNVFVVIPVHEDLMGPPVGIAGTTRCPGEIELHDFNQDGELDIVCVRNERILVWIGDGNGSFSVPLESIISAEVSFIYDFVIDDFNMDGILDLVAWTQRSGSYVLMSVRGIGDGRFEYPQKIYAHSGSEASTIHSSEIAVADLNGDAISDLVTHGKVFIGHDGSEYLEPQTVSDVPVPSGVTIGDLFGSEHEDMIFWTQDISFSVVTNHWPDVFGSAMNYSTPAKVKDMAIVDINRDGRMDIIALCLNTLFLMLNEG